ncbi:hypothetical protein POM88_039855 [Heracleum sosnowskyi]|uniref:hAT-like transposase RNase-H fold domain-containing protein n=1 Tax=Heracleum sosnowskyi TaxID=360622 RepID=A0AAD8M984_9APIA|nr:hypothetical protein POM88_039855 [Heracleum sosnowskyi]
MFDKYWNDMYLVLAIATVMDPRCKMKYVEFSSLKYEDNSVNQQFTAILEAIQGIYDDYKRHSLEPCTSMSDPVLKPSGSNPCDPKTSGLQPFDSKPSDSDSDNKLLGHTLDLGDDLPRHTLEIRCTLPRTMLSTCINLLAIYLSQQDEVFKTITNAPRRLLQVAVRDALGSPKMNSLGSEPSLKPMRSVVSASAGYSSLRDRAQRIQSVARVPNASMVVAIKAVAKVAKDAGKIKSSGNVFNRLGC